MLQSRMASCQTRAPLSDIVSNIVRPGPTRLAPDDLQDLPDLLDELKVTELAAAAWWQLAYPQIADRNDADGTRVYGNGCTRCGTDSLRAIGNLVLMLGGRKRWTLAAPNQSRYLRPTPQRMGGRTSSRRSRQRT